MMDSKNAVKQELGQRAGLEGSIVTEGRGHLQKHSEGSSERGLWDFGATRARVETWLQCKHHLGTASHLSDLSLLS